MIDVQINTPVLPNKATETKLIKQIAKIVKDKNCKVRFFKSGVDFYGQVNFTVAVIDANKNELDTLQNQVMTEIFNTLFNN